MAKLPGLPRARGPRSPAFVRDVSITYVCSACGGARRKLSAEKLDAAMVRTLIREGWRPMQIAGVLRCWLCPACAATPDAAAAMVALREP
jgi:hypothetical protein